MSYKPTTVENNNGNTSIDRSTASVGCCFFRYYYFSNISNGLKNHQKPHTYARTHARTLWTVDVILFTR